MTNWRSVSVLLTCKCRTFQVRTHSENTGLLPKIKVPVIGGCGSFYAITIASKSFTDLSTVKQHRLVNDALKEEIKGIHGLQVHIISFYASYTGAEDLRQLKTIPDSEQK